MINFFWCDFFLRVNNQQTNKYKCACVYIYLYLYTNKRRGEVEKINGLW